METLERWLRDWSLAISLLLALIVCYLLGTNGVVSEQVMPFGDSEHYVLRGMELYGYLHTGQWARFWDLFTLPQQSLAPPHYWLFFLLPQGWASMTSYGVIQGVTTYGLLALGVWMLCRVLDRAAWAPALFLLCATQNISLDASYFYFTDVPFLAVGTIAMAWQVQAWRDVNWRNSLLSGVGAGLMFWVKAPNAIIFAGTYLIAELARVTVLGWMAKKEDVTIPSPPPFKIKGLARHFILITTGFVPVAFLALACGGFQSIVRLVDTNEVSGLFTTTLECGGLLRLFYFPLCLTFFYHAGVMLVIFAVLLLSVRIMARRASTASHAASPAERFPALLLLPLIVAYLFLGEYFSFGMEYKVVRSLLLVLPIFWLSIFWGLEQWRVRPGLIFLAAAAYVTCGYSQILYNAFGSREVNADSYQLKDDWLSRFPPCHFDGPSGIGMTNDLLGLIQKAMPQGGKVAIGTEQLFLTSESLSWALQHNLALQGQHPPYEFDNFLASDGRYCRSALVSACGMLVFVHPSLQYSPAVQKASIDLLNFTAGAWSTSGSARVIPLRTQGNEILGALVVMKNPLTDAQITQLIAATHATELPADVEFNPAVYRRLTWRECWDILGRWKQKRLGQVTP
jgi:hypothetical protein